MIASTPAIQALREVIPSLCRGDHSLLSKWLTDKPRSLLCITIPCIILGCSSYGFSMGYWHGWKMAAFVALKLPILIFCTLAVNGLINGLLAQVLNSGISMRQSMQFLLTGFAAMAVILGSLSPITLGLAIQAPAPHQDSASDYHAATLLTHTTIIAYAGIVAHLSLLGFLKHFCPTPQAATMTFLAWISGNLFVGAQLSWVLRPFFGSPNLQVAFLREDPFRGTFYETVWHSILHFF
ncbi:hypothetical protein ACFPK9_11825 [Rubritalea spongiae]|uniref:Uncharacterized protein n=1 Tax=Rubritalea spongiae TaxID=430797 RepID=A0ABW5DYQ4_9BACT